MDYLLNKKARRAEMHGGGEKYGCFCSTAAGGEACSERFFVPLEILPKISNKKLDEWDVHAAQRMIGCLKQLMQRQEKAGKSLMREVTQERLSGRFFMVWLAAHISNGENVKMSILGKEKE